MQLIFVFISFNSTVNEYLHSLYDYLYANLNSHFFTLRLFFDSFTYT